MGLSKTAESAVEFAPEPEGGNAGQSLQKKGFMVASLRRMTVLSALPGRDFVLAATPGAAAEPCQTTAMIDRPSCSQRR